MGISYVRDVNLFLCSQQVTGLIHQNIEAVIAGKAVQNGAVLRCPDLFRSGKQKWKEVKVNALKKKTPTTKFKERITKKLAKLAAEGKEM